MNTAFGLDLAGYSSGNTGFARADRKPGKRISITVYRGNGFCRKLMGRDLLEDSVRVERQIITACLERACLVVDVPIDLQGLPRVQNPCFAWELSRRPVDYAFSALAPLADRIGAPVARFMHWMEPLTQKQNWLGVKLWETYPAASLELLRIKAVGYKSKSAIWNKDRWAQAHPGHQVIADILHTLDWAGCDGDIISDDEFDASLCALTGVVVPECRLEGRSLRDEIHGRLSCKITSTQRNRIRSDAPQGFVLLALPPIEMIHIQVRHIRNQEEMLRELSK